ncbi:17751_t:CDS:2, partial [Racocetra fulgida]
NGLLYSVNSLLAAIRAINRFYNSNVSKIKPVDLYDHLGISDYEVLTITNHRSLSSLAHYEWPKDGVQKATLNSLITILETSEPLLDIQNHQPNILPTTDSYNKFRSAKQIYQDK